MPFDNLDEAAEHHAYMTDYFSRVYANKGSLFYKKCLFVCNNSDKPIATAFIWKAYDEISTIHWLKVIKTYEIVLKD